MGMYMVGVPWFGPVFVVGSRSRLGLTSAVLCLCLSECSGCLRKSGLAVHAGLRLKRSAFFRRRCSWSCWAGVTRIFLLCADMADTRRGLYGKERGWRMWSAWVFGICQWYHWPFVDCGCRHPCSFLNAGDDAPPPQAVSRGGHSWPFIDCRGGHLRLFINRGRSWPFLETGD